MPAKQHPIGYKKYGMCGKRYKARIKIEGGWKNLTKDEALDVGIPWPQNERSRAVNPNSRHYSEKMPLIGSKSPEHAGKLKKHQAERPMRIKSTEGMRLVRVDEKTEIYAHPNESDSEVKARWEAKRNKAA